MFIFRLRKRTAEAGKYRTFGYPVTPILFIALSAWVVYLQVSANVERSLEVLALLGAGAVVYIFTVAGRARTPIEADE